MKFLLPILLLSLLSPVATADQAQQRKASVATGATVALAPSARSPAEWTVARPGVRALRPRVRGTFE